VTTPLLAESATPSWLVREAVMTTRPASGSPSLAAAHAAHSRRTAEKTGRKDGGMGVSSQAGSVIIARMTGYTQQSARRIQLLLLTWWCMRRSPSQTAPTSTGIITPVTTSGLTGTPAALSALPA
jgi:hypothetical protein